MKMFTRSMLMVVLLSSFSITAIHAQESDLLGIFFDESGAQTTVETTEPYEVVPFYLILMEPSHGEGIHDWECILEARTGDEPAMLFNWQYGGGGVNADQPPRFFVFLSTPLPPAAAIVLASGEVLVPDTATEILFYLRSYDPPSLQDPPGWGYPVMTPLYAYGDDLYQSLGWTSGCEAEPVARMNEDGDDPVWSLGDLPEEILFGYVPAGETVTRNFYLENAGEVALSGQIDISGEGFLYRHSYLPWTSDSHWYRIEPGDGEFVQIHLESTTDEAYEGALDVTVCGETTTIALVKQSAFYSCTIEPAVLDFGVIDLYAPGPWEAQVTVTNDGTVALDLVVDEDCPDFVVESSCELIPPGESCDLWVTFDPSELGIQECVVSINNGLCELVCVAVVVDGPSQCVITPPGWDFGLVWAGEPAQQSFEVWNIGGQQLEGQVTIPELCPGFTLVSGAEPFSLAHDEAHYFTVEFNPVESGFQVCSAFVSAECTDVELVGRGLVPSVGPTEDCLHYEKGVAHLVGRVDTPGGPTDIEIMDGYAYASVSYYPEVGGGLQVIDISDPENPQTVGSVDVSDSPRGVTVAGSFAYVAAGDSGLQVVDVSKPWNPRIVGNADCLASDVAVKGNRAYVVGGEYLKVFDVSVPDNPIMTGQANLECYADHVAVFGNHAFAGGEEGWGGPPSWYAVLRVINISGPVPEVVASVEYETSSSVRDLTFSGSHLYMAVYFIHYEGNYGSLQVIDISEPESPWIVGEAYTPGSANDVAVSGKYVYIADGASLQVLDISEPESPWIICYEDIPIGEVAVAGNYIYAGAGDSRIRVYDITGTLSSPIVGSVDTPGTARDVAISGSHAFVADGPSGLQAIEITDPENAEITSSISMADRTFEVEVSDSHAYVGITSVLPDYYGSLQVIDITDPENLHIEGGVSFPDASPSGIAYSDGYACVVTRSGPPAENGFLNVVDVTNPEIPETVGAMPLPISPRDVAISNTYAIVVGRPEGLNVDGRLLIADISSPENPSIVSNVNIGHNQYPRTVKVQGSYVYVVVWYYYGQDLRIFDISDPTGPQLVSSVDVPELTSGIAVSTGGAYLVGQDDLHALTIADHENPKIRGHLGTRAGGNEIALSDSYVYIAAGDAGLKITLRQCGDLFAFQSKLADSGFDVGVPRAGLPLAVHPNPFNPQATITFARVRDEKVSIVVYDLTGRRVVTLASQSFAAGPHTLIWNGRDAMGHTVSSGTYIVRLESESGVEAEKVSLIK